MGRTGVTSLQRQCCRQICRCGIAAAEYAVQQLPVFMAPAMLAAATRSQLHDVASCIISNWPLPVLRIHDVLQGEFFDVLTVEMGFDIALFSAVTARKPSCRLTTLDLRGIRINRSFRSLILQAWPLLSLDKEQLNTAYLTQQIIDTADARLLELMERTWQALSVDQSQVGRISFGRLLRQTNELPASAVLELRLNELLCHEQMKNPKLAINLPEGTQLDVKLDDVQFDASTAEYLDFLIISCLHSLTSVHIVPTSILLWSSPQTVVDIANDIAVQSAKVILEQRPHAGLSGLCLHGIDLSLAWVTWQLPRRWSCDWLTAIGLRGCSLDISDGARPRGHGRRLRWLIRLLSSIPNLVTLDLGDNYLADNLGVILDTVRQPLERLRLASCDFTDADINSLVSSRHMATLQVLNMKNCMSGLHGDAQTMSRRLVRSLHRCSALRSLDFVDNSLTDANELCMAFSSRCWPKLESLDISGNPVSDAEVTRLVVSALASCCRVRRLRLPIASIDGPGYGAFVKVMDAIAEAGHRLNVRVQPHSQEIVVFDANKREDLFF